MKKAIHAESKELGVEASVRCYDPCLSCSTHALGHMSMIVELKNRRGETVDRLAR